MAYLYILQSVHLGKFYIGSTNSAPADRLKKHLANHNGFTAKAKDWIVVYTEFFDELNDAKKREQQIKKWKSPIRVQQLIKRSSTE